MRSTVPGSFPWSADLCLLGLTTRLEADDPALLAAVLRAYAAWPSPPIVASSPNCRLRLRLGIPPGLQATERIHLTGARLSLQHPDAQGVADAATREAWCRLSPRLLEEPERLASEVLDTLLLFLLTRLGRTPLHAAALLLGETAVLLAGRSGAGKSTLALEALNAGLPVLSDDTVYIESGARFRIWGFPRALHVLPGQAIGSGGKAVGLRLRRGRWKQRIEHPGLSARPFAERGVLCLLERGRRVAMEPAGVEEAVAVMLDSLEAGFDHFRDALPEVVRRIAAAGCWRLTLDADPRAGLAAIRDTLDAQGVHGGGSG